MKISKKKLLAIALTLTTFLAVFAVLRPGVSTEVLDLDDYCWIEGVLHNDTYALYPYAQESIDIGFSKYGEMIGYNEDTGIGLGIQYPGYTSAASLDEPDGTYDQTEDTSVDPFCNEYIGVDWWMNGWFIDIKYRTPAGVYREIWAMAMFSDGQQHGGDWITMPSVEATSTARPLWQEHPPYANPSTTVYSDAGYTPLPGKGGRKTNGACETEPIQIIYNGPRKLVALCKTTISDVGGGADLVALYFTFIFNKAEKNVIILKDVKRLYTKQPMDIQFGNRGEWDLGLAGDTDSYTHWYTDEPVQYWDMQESDSGDIDADEVETSFEFFKDWMLTYKHPKKWWDDVAERPDTVYNEFSGAAGEDFPDTWLETRPTCYGREWHMDKTIKEHSYALAQIISRAGDYVGALAVWPHPEFWSAANTYFPPARTKAPTGTNPSSIPLMLAPISRMLEWHKWTVDEDPNQGELLDLPDRDDIWVKVDDIRYPDGTTIEPIIPFTIYEHDFELSSSLREYRIVSVYMLTDYHDADDADADDPGNDEVWSSGLNVIDREIQYQLDEIFDPWDIYDAMHKGTKRWVQFFNRDIGGYAWNGLDYYQIQLDDTREVESGLVIPTLPVIGENWDAYCSFSERVMVDTGAGYELIYPLGYQNIDPIPGIRRSYYTIDRDTGVIAFYEWRTGAYRPWYLPVGSVVKVLWSSEHHATTAEQWDEYDLLYPVGNVTHIFPLHHDITDAYKPETEVFHDDIPILGGDYVFNNASKTLYMQDPVPAGEWLAAYYTVDSVEYLDFFEGDGERTVFVLQAYPDVGSLLVWDNDILQQIVEEGSELIQPEDAYIPVPKGDCYWRSTDNGTYEAATWLVFSGLEEREWLAATDIRLKVRGNWIIHETSTCDELVIDQTILDLQPGSELKIVFKVPSGRWEWGVVGEPSAPVDSIGSEMVVAAFKNKLIEFGFGGLDVQDSTFGPRVPWLIREDISPDSIGRYHLQDDWCTTWPISSSNIITVGGTYPNMVSKYFNDFTQALVGTTIGNGYYPVTCWDNDLSGRGKVTSPSGFYDGGLVTDRFGHAAISTYKDKNGTVGFIVHGWTGQDTYYAAKWFDENKFVLQHIDLHVTDLILRITYKTAKGVPICPPRVGIVETLGTISEINQHDC